jgi:hypothetical protein
MTGGGSSFVDLGAGGLGQMIVSSGTVTAGPIYVGSLFGASGNHDGTLMVSGGSVQAEFLIGQSTTAATGTVWFTGGTLSGHMSIGDTGVGSMYVSSSAYFHPSESIFVGNQSGSVGSLSLQGGSTFSSREIDDLEIGVSAGGTGTVWVTDGFFQATACDSPVVGDQGSGRFSATNSMLRLSSFSVGSQGTFECVGSQLQVFGPCATVNNNLMSFVNSIASFSTVNNAGTIVANNSTLTFLQPLNNGGCIVATNGTVLFSGGITNSGAVLLSPSQFCITSIVATGSDVVITWPAFGGNHYRVQAANSFTDTFSDVTADIVASGTGLGTTNYVDSGALTNNPGLFYRIHQVY